MIANHRQYRIAQAKALRLQEEAGMVLRARLGPGGPQDLHDLLAALDIEIVAFDAADARASLDAFDHYGKGLPTSIAGTHTMKSTKFDTLLQKLTFILFSLFLVASCMIFVPRISHAETNQNDAKYLKMLEVVKNSKNPSSDDFGKLRDVYSKSSYYHGNESDAQGIFLNFKAGMILRKDDKSKADFEKTMKEVIKTTEDNYPMWLGHATLAAFYLQLSKRPEFKNKAGRLLAIHGMAFVRIKESILRSGSGSSANDAIKVLSIYESIFIIDELGYEKISQALVNENGRKYDMYTVKDKKGVTKKVWVDISAFLH